VINEATKLMNLCARTKLDIDRSVANAFDNIRLEDEVVALEKSSSKTPTKKTETKKVQAKKAKTEKTQAKKTPSNLDIQEKVFRAIKGASKF